MATEVWFRNPDRYIRECVELGINWLVWDRGYAIKRGVDPLRHADLYYGAGNPFRLLVTGDQGTAELGPGRDMANPVAVYPSWECGADSLDVLEEMLANPVGQDERACADSSLPPDERPVFGQEHRVLVLRPPSANTGYGKHVYRLLHELQDDYPDAILHVHGLYSYRYAFGLGYGAVDIEPRTGAQKGKVTLPNGREMTYEKAADQGQWVRVVGFKPEELSVPRNRCMFNMRTAQWAGEHYKENFRFRTTRNLNVDVDVPDASFLPHQTRIMTRPAVSGLGDRFLCDLCSLKDRCKYFRIGSVCTIPDSEPSELVKRFKSRDADEIIDGLGALLGKQSERLETMLDAERTSGGELFPEVTRVINSLFSNGVKLAKLLKPELNGGTRVAIAVGSGGSAVLSSGAPTHQLVASVVAELEAKGVKREDITSDMIMKAIMPADAVDAIDPDAIDI